MERPLARCLPPANETPGRDVILLDMREPTGPRAILLLLALLLPALLSAKKPRAAEEPAAAADALSVTDLSLQVWALQRLHDLEMTPDQMKVLRAMSAETAERDAKRDKPKAPDKYVKTLRDLREALLKGDDEDRITELHDDADEMEEGDDVDVDDEVTVTAAARARTPEVLKMLAPSQVAAYVAAYQDEIPDPVATLMDAADDSRDAEGDELQSLIDDTADELGPLIGGLEADKVRAVSGAVRAWVKHARGLSDADFKAQRGELEKSAHALVGDVDAFAVLRHWVERDVSELLSNPQLAAAIDARLKAAAP